MGGGRGRLPRSFIPSGVKRIQRENSVVETKTRTDVAIRLKAGGVEGRGLGGSVCPSRGKGGPSQKRTQSPARESREHRLWALDPGGIVRIHFHGWLSV